MSLKHVALTVAVLAGVVVIGSGMPGVGHASTWNTSSDAGPTATEAPTITHGPILGRPGAHAMGVWARTSQPAEIEVRYRPAEGENEETVATAQTHRRDDNTGWVHLRNLQAETTYAYTVTTVDGTDERSGTFRTLPDPEDYRHPEYNPEGLFNFSFEHGACNFQFRRGDSSYAMPAYRSMLRQSDRIDFQIMSGDFIYETERGTSVETWSEQQGGDFRLPEVVRDMPDIVGVWENYKTYFDRASYLNAWHRQVPAFFMFDDHEILNDINGAGTPGHRDRRAVFRDVGVSAWQDYLGWSNPVPESRRDIHHGQAQVTEGGFLIDSTASFEGLGTENLSTLHVHWNDDHPTAGVYEVKEVRGPNRLKISPAPQERGDQLRYSIGARSYYRFQVSNTEIFVVDTRSFRDVHDKDRPAKEGVSMLGEVQREWLEEGMRESDADLFFVVSSVSLSIPHVSTNDPEKDESWTSYLDERESLIEFWEGLDAPVLVLTGDLHNSMAINVSDNVKEYLSGHHNSPNHDYSDEAYRPPSGPFGSNPTGSFDSAGRTVDIQWSSFVLDDTPGEARQVPHYSVLTVKNVVNSPAPDGSDRWIAYPEPQVVVQYYHGITGKLLYAESVTTEADHPPAFEQNPDRR